MKSLMLTVGFSLLALTAWCQPPYSGTIFFDPDIITADDPSALESVTYIGQDSRLVYDRRQTGWTTITAYLFEIIWDDGLRTEAQINQEFGSVDSARVIAQKYGFTVGQLPTCFRKDVDALWIHAGVEPFGGGNRSLLIHTGQSALYERDGILEETLVHEAAHTSLDADHAGSEGWKLAQQMDPTFISTYAQDNPTREDIAESLLPWLAVRHRRDRISQSDYDLITRAIPNRLTYFDEMTCNLYPLVQTTGIDPLTIASRVDVYPNPTVGQVTVKGLPYGTWHVSVWNASGVKISENIWRGDNQIDLSQWPRGLYAIRFEGEGVVFSRRVVKQ